MLCLWSSFSAQIPLLYILPWNSKRIRDQESPPAFHLPPLPGVGKVPSLPASFLRGSSPSTCLPLTPHREPVCQGALLMRFPSGPPSHTICCPTWKQLHHAVCLGPAVHREQVAWAISPPILASLLPSLAGGIRAQYTETLRTGSMLTPSQAPERNGTSVGTEAM